MPLHLGKSKKAFEKNVSTEMKSGKPLNQSLAIAYNVKKKAPRHKMAEGGLISAKTEKRPMPESKANDSKMIAESIGKKALVDSGALSRPDIKQSQKGMKTTPIKHPSMPQSPVFKVKMRTLEDHLQEAAGVNDGPQEQPPEDYNEEEADKSGPSVPALGMKKMAKGGMINEEESMAASEEDGIEHPEGLESDDDQEGPAESEYMSSHFAEGGEVEEEHHDSIAAAIMAKRQVLHDAIDSGAMDEDHAAMMAEGGEVDIDENAEEQPNSYYASNEHAALKENYDSDMDDVSQPEDSNEHGDSREDESENKLDKISAIRSRMNKQRQFRK